MLRFSMILTALACAGCHWNLTDPGTDPKPAQLYFPTGIVMDPGGRFLYVSNGNADLAYGGGTVQMYDTFKFECTVARFRMLNAGVTPPAQCKLDDANTAKGYDDAMKAAKCQWDPFTPSIVDCDETPFVLPNSTVKIGNFAGEIRLQRDPDPTEKDFHRRLYVAVRGDPSITWIDVLLPGSSLPTAPKSLYEPGVLQCFAPGTTIDTLKMLPGYDPKTNQTSSPPGCDSNSHLIEQYLCHNVPNCVLPTAPDGIHTPLPVEPFGMQLDTSLQGASFQYARLLVAHQASGQVTLIDAPVRGVPNLLNVSDPFFQPDANGNHGAFGLAEQHPHDPTSDWYLTTNLFPAMATFRIAEANVVLPEQQISLQSTYAFGNDVRDIQFDPSGNRAFVTVNNPPTLLTLDTRTLPGNGGLPADTVTSVVDVCQTPSHFAVRRFVVPGAPGEPPHVQTRVYVVCFLSSQVMVVDPDQPEVLNTIFGAIGGPNEITFNFSSFDDQPDDQITQLLPHRAYVSNFSESTIATIDLEPGSPTENQVIARLGFPPTGYNP